MRLNRWSSKFTYPNLEDCDICMLFCSITFFCVLLLFQTCSKKQWSNPLVLITMSPSNALLFCWVVKDFFKLIFKWSKFNEFRRNSFFHAYLGSCLPWFHIFKTFGSQCTNDGSTLPLFRLSVCTFFFLSHISVFKLFGEFFAWL